MLDVKDLVEGVTKVRILTLPSDVKQKIGDVGVFILNDNSLLPIKVRFATESWWFVPNNLEIVQDEDVSKESVHKVSSDMSSQSEDLIIYKSRWDEIIENLEGGYGMSDEEVEIVKSVLKNNTPFNVVPDLEVVDPVIEKENQTHLDANYVGVGRNGCFYYRSDILKQWFYWNEGYEWGKCDFDYGDVNDTLPVSFGESK